MWEGASFFLGIVRIIYVLFVGSTKKWNALLKHVSSLTVKSLYNICISNENHVTKPA
jgi:hypothetical protein